jgi:hypothetical protein
MGRTPDFSGIPTTVPENAHVVKRTKFAATSPLA